MYLHRRGGMTENLNADDRNRCVIKINPIKISHAEIIENQVDKSSNCSVAKQSL